MSSTQRSRQNAAALETVGKTGGAASLATTLMTLVTLRFALALGAAIGLSLAATPLTATADITFEEFKYVRDQVDYLFKRSGMELTTEERSPSSEEMPTADSAVADGMVGSRSARAEALIPTVPYAPGYRPKLEQRALNNP